MEEVGGRLALCWIGRPPMECRGWWSAAKPRARRARVSLLPSTRRGRFGAALAALLLVALVAEVAHRASVGHVVCPEHGELTHVAQAGAPSTSSTWDGAPRVVPSDHGEPSHEHCALGYVRRDVFDLAFVEPGIALVPPAPVRMASIPAVEPLERIALGCAWARGPPALG